MMLIIECIHAQKVRHFSNGKLSFFWAGIPTNTVSSVCIAKNTLYSGQCTGVRMDRMGVFIYVRPLNCGISPVGLLGNPLWHASLVRATVTPQLPNRNPIC